MSTNNTPIDAMASFMIIGMMMKLMTNHLPHTIGLYGEPDDNQCKYPIPTSVANALESSMKEELLAADWYKRRAENARVRGDNVTAQLWDHIAEEEIGHYNEFKDRLNNL